VSRSSLSLDFEGKSEIDLKKCGLDVYSAHPSTEITMAAYRIDEGRQKHWQAEDGPVPKELEEALLDPHVEKRAFNAQFERVMTRRVLKIKTPIKNWRCTMVLAYMQSFTGGLEQVARQMKIPADLVKLDGGKKYIDIFSKPQRVTKNQPFRWRDSFTDPDLWEEFVGYNKQDEIAEKAVRDRLIKFPIQKEEWDFYELDQEINDRGMPIDRLFVENAIRMAKLRKDELLEEMRDVTGLMNPGSRDQLLAWLRERGYPFADLQKGSVEKVLTEHKVALSEGRKGLLSPEAQYAMELRQNYARTSLAKYDAILNRLGADDRLRFTFQFAGASRTNRFAGRGMQPQNLPRTPKWLEDIKPKEDSAYAVHQKKMDRLQDVRDIVRSNDFPMLSLYAPEPLDALAGSIRSSIVAPEGYEFVVADLSAIESRGIGWVSNCTRLLKVFTDGRDPYLDFGSTLYNKDYSDVTKGERTNAKPAVLGAGYRLSGGDLKDGKKTGLWGYAENMKIELTRDESHRAVKLFREGYPEIPKLWYALEKAAEDCLRFHRDTVPIIRMPGKPDFHVPVVFEWRKPYMCIVLPSGRRMFYHMPRMEKKTFFREDGSSYDKINFSYMGKQQNGSAWVRIVTHGGKLVENIVQALARDILKMGMVRAAKEGFKIFIHVHDEIGAIIRKGDNYFTAQLLGEIMSQEIDWCKTMPLGAEGYTSLFYRKD